MIIGAASGIGASVMERFVREGAQVWGTGRRGPDIEAAAASAGALPATVDPSVQADLNGLATRLRDEAGHLDILVVSAGLSEPALLEEVTEDHFDRHFDLNVRALLFATQTFVPLMRAGSSIVLVGSIAGSKGVPARGVYSATKAAVRTLARSWTSELAPRGIRVNLVSPGPTDTAMMAWTTPQEREALLGMIPMGRMGRPEEVAAAALFLASDESSYVAGVELFVDGGMAQV
ncbi:SDR family oxidoreductase [Lysobacter sp. D1-1-M9]|uniref:SDR family NAD(P)-dependent oxidoreductase n=1 Tax=Novilysobacter longmucuonensis TaxID=3098603 RepID=UPI002FC8B080